jgi:hypothetical protein
MTNLLAHKIVPRSISLRTCDGDQTGYQGSAWRVERVKRTFDSSVVDSLTAGSGGAATAVLLNSWDPDHVPGLPGLYPVWEHDIRSYWSNTFDPGVEFVRFRTRLQAGMLFSPPTVPLVNVEWMICQGTWGAGTPTYDSIGSVIASGSIAPDSTYYVSGTHVDVDAILPVVGGLAQFVLLINPAQAYVNADRMTYPNDIVAMARYPNFHADTATPDPDPPSANQSDDYFYITYPTGEYYELACTSALMHLPLLVINQGLGADNLLAHKIGVTP